MPQDRSSAGRGQSRPLAARRWRDTAPCRTAETTAVHPIWTADKRADRDTPAPRAQTRLGRMRRTGMGRHASPRTP
jgi:hypothetical protein